MFKLITPLQFVCEILMDDVVEVRIHNTYLFS